MVGNSMKVPLRFQVTEFDCGTVSLLNAFSYLFDRKEIPAKLVKAIHSYTLDCYDEYGNKTSGIIEVSNDKTGFIVTGHFINRFNTMIEKYGKKFQPELKKNQGVIKIDKTNYYFISNQSMGYFLTLNDLRRMDVNATKKK